MRDRGNTGQESKNRRVRPEGEPPDHEATQKKVKRLEAALKEMETRYKALFEHMSNGVAIYKPKQGGKDFILVNLNKAAEKIEKIKKEKVIGKSLLQVFPAMREFGLLDVFRTVHRTGKPGDHPVTKYKDDRLEGWRDHFVYRLPSGEIVTVYSDETRRKQAEEAMRRSEERFRALVESVPDCIFTKDRDLRYTYVNPAMENLLATAASEIIGRRAEDFFGEDAGKHIRESDRRVLEVESVEGEHTSPFGGVYLTFHDIRVPLRSGDGGIVGVCGIARNITERRKFELDVPAIATDCPSAAMRDALNKAFFAASTDSIILLLGESGSGKDFLARWIHNHSKRLDGPFFSINCAAIAPELAESELFGHEHGAFTGTRGRKRGLLELAEGGTLLLNEIGELPLSLQSKLLTFLDTRSFMRVGGEKSVHVDARLIAATHRSLEEEVEKGRFLQPLFYRLSVFPIEVPPLRERIEDIPVIVEALMSKLAADMQLSEIPVLDAADLAALSRYHWPGNIRELRNVLERSLMLSGLGPFRLALSVPETSREDWSMTIRFLAGRTLRDIGDEVAQSLVSEAVRRCGGSKKEAAKLLGISRDSIHRYIRRFRAKGGNLTRT